MAYMRSGLLGATAIPIRPSLCSQPGRPLVSCRQFVPPPLETTNPLPGRSSAFPVVHGGPRDAHTVRIFRINDDCTNLLAVAQAEMLPSLSAVSGLVNSVADREVRPPQ